MTSIAVVVLDTLRKDAFDRHFGWLPGRRFQNAWSTSHWTVPAHASLFTGSYPSEVGVHAKSVSLDCEGPVLAERLQREGYTTRAWSANPYVSPVFDYDRGFGQFTGNWRLRQLHPEVFDWNRFVSETSDEGRLRYLRAIARCVRDDCDTIPSLVQGVKLKLRDWNTLGYVDDDGASEALSYVRETKFGTDEFLYVNLMEAHTPYDPPAEYRTTDVTHGHGLLETITDADDGSLDRQEVARAYDDCVRYLSDVYEEMFDALVDAFDYVITLSDHGELLGEHGGWGHGYGLYEELTNVPMSVYGPDVQAGSVQHVVSLTDAFWTVIDLAADSDRHGERSVLEGGRTDSVLTEYHGFTRLRRNKLRDAGVDSDLLVRYDRLFRGIAGGDWYGFESPEGFDLSGGLDREEAKARLADRVRRLDRSESDDGGREMSEEVLHHLEELGYV